MPAVSSQQRRWAFGKMGEAWARRHHFDTKGPLPKYAHGKKKSSAKSKAKRALRGALGKMK